MCDYESPEFINFTDRKARKPHRCCECGGVIGIGEKYQHVVGKWDNEISYYNQCYPCADLWEYMNNNTDCLSFSGLLEALIEHDFDVPRNLLSHPMLMSMHEKEIEDAENQGDNGVEIVPAVDRTLAGLLKVHKINSNPRLWKEYQKELLKRASEAGRLLNYYTRQAIVGGYHGEWCAKQLEKAVV